MIFLDTEPESVEKHLELYGFKRLDGIDEDDFMYETKDGYSLNICSFGEIDDNTLWDIKISDIGIFSGTITTLNEFNVVMKCLGFKKERGL